MNSSLGKLIVELGLDTKDFQSGLDKADGSLGRFGASAAKGGMILGTAVAAGGALAAVGLTKAVMSAASFEKQIDAVGAVSQASEKDMKGLSDAALRIGKDTAFSASEAAGAMEILAANGLTATQIMGGAADATVALAAAGGTDLATAADVASTAMKVWNLEGAELTDVVNRVAGAANVSRFGVEDMSQAIAQGAGVAAMAGVSMEDFTTAIAASADMFSSGSDAGTSYKSMIMRLINPIGQGADAIAEYGLEFRNADGSLKGFADIAGELQSKLGGLTQAQRDQAMAAIFGNDAIRAATGLYRAGKEGFEEMSKTMGETDAQAIAAQRMGNLSGAIESLKGSFETIMITIGMQLLPVLTELANWLAQFLPQAFDWLINNAVPVFQEWWVIIQGLATTIATALSPAIQAVADVAGPLFEQMSQNTAVMQTVGIVVGTILVGAFLMLAVAAGAAAVSMIAALLPFIAIAAAIGLLVAGIVLLIQHWDQVVEKFPAAGEAVEQVRQIWADFMAWVKADFAPAFSDLAEAVSAAMVLIVGFVRRYGDEIVAVFGAWLNLILGVVTAVFHAIQGVIQGSMMVITGIINVIVGILTGDWSRAWDGIKQIVEGVWILITTLVKFHIEMTLAIITGVLDILSAAWDLAWSLIKDALVAVWNEIKDTASAGIDKLKEAVGNGLNEIRDWFTNLPGELVNALSSLGGMLYDLGVQVIKAMFDGIKSVSPWDVAKGIGGSIKDGLTSGLGSLIGFSPSPFGIAVGEDLVDGIAVGAEDASKVAAGIGQDIANPVDKYLSEVATSGDWLNDWLTHIPAAGREAATRMGKAFAEGAVTIDDAMTEIKETLIASTLTTGEWLEYIDASTQQAAHYWNSLSDDVRFALGENLELMQSWADHGLQVFEDFSIDVHGVLGGMVDDATQAASQISAALGTVAGGQLAGGWGPAPMQVTGPVGGGGSQTSGIVPYYGGWWDTANGPAPAFDPLMQSGIATYVGPGGSQQGSGGLTVQQNAPVYIYANDSDGGQASYDDYAYNVTTSLARKGVVAGV